MLLLLIVPVTSCEAMSASSALLEAWLTNAAGVASVSLLVTTTPVSMPNWLFAASKRVPHFLPSELTPIAELYDLIPQAKAVAPAAESVMREEDERERCVPMSKSSRGSGFGVE